MPTLTQILQNKHNPVNFNRYIFPAAGIYGLSTLSEIKAVLSDRQYTDRKIGTTTHDKNDLLTDDVIFQSVNTLVKKTGRIRFTQSSNDICIADIFKDNQQLINITTNNNERRSAYLDVIAGDTLTFNIYQIVLRSLTIWTRALSGTTLYGVKLKLTLTVKGYLTYKVLESKSLANIGPDTDINTVDFDTQGTAINTARYWSNEGITVIKLKQYDASSYVATADTSIRAVFENNRLTASLRVAFSGSRLSLIQTLDIVEEFKISHKFDFNYNFETQDTGTYLVGAGSGLEVYNL